MTIALIIIGLLLLGGGIVGAVAPVLPGPALSFVGLLALYFAIDGGAFSWVWLVVFGVFAVIFTVLDLWFPIFAAKKYGSSNAGAIGGGIGLVIGILVGGFVGIVLGPLVGAIIGELIGGNTYKEALKSGWGSFIGFLIGTFLKLAYCIAAIIFGTIQAVDDFPWEVLNFGEKFQTLLNMF